jgi:putative SOS response-associated peptidase YedK
MCSRYILVNTIEQIENRFGLPKQNIITAPNYNISTGMSTAVITGTKPKEVQYFIFGMTPFHAKKEMHLINARSEVESNSSDNPDFKGAKGIIQNKDFRKPIRSQRCLVLASAFVKGAQNEVCSKPFLFYMRNHKSPYAIVGICDTWLNTANGETLN